MQTWLNTNCSVLGTLPNCSGTTTWISLKLFTSLPWCEFLLWCSVGLLHLKHIPGWLLSWCSVGHPPLVLLLLCWLSPSESYAACCQQIFLQWLLVVKETPLGRFLLHTLHWAQRGTGACHMGRYSIDISEILVYKVSMVGRTVWHAEKDKEYQISTSSQCNHRSPELPSDIQPPI